MTLVLSLATHEYAFQVADKRVTGCDGKVYSEDQVKLTWFNGSIAFGVTGLAKIDGVRTDHWLAHTLSHSACKTNQGGIEHLAQTAQIALDRTRLPVTLNRKQVTRLAFGGVARANVSGRSPIEVPLASPVRNCELTPIRHFGRKGLSGKTLPQRTRG